MPVHFLNILNLICSCSTLVIGVTGFAYRMYIDNKKAHGNILTLDDLIAFGTAIDEKLNEATDNNILDINENNSTFIRMDVIGNT